MDRAIMEYLLNALWQVPLIAGGASLLLWLVRPVPQIQHRIWLAVLGAAVLLPMHGIVHEPTHAKSPAGVQPPLLSPASFSPQAASQRWRIPLPHTVRVQPVVGRWLVRLYLGSVLLGLVRFGRAWRTAYRLVAQSQPTLQHQASLVRLSRRLGVRMPAVRETAEVMSPMVVGAVTPVLLLPKRFDRFSEEEICAALCHELAHIQRRDYLSNAMCHLVALPLLWHPVVHAVQARIHMTREILCDAMAAAEMGSKISYANCLLNLARSMLVTPSKAGEAQLLSLLGNHTLEERMMQLTETATIKLRLQSARLVAAAAIAIASAVLAATVHIVPAMAQTSAPREDSKALAKAPGAPVAHVPPAIRAQHAGRLQQRKAKQPAGTMTALFGSSQFKQQIEEAQRQASHASDVFNNPEFQRQLADAQSQVSAARDLLNNQDFKHQMDDAQKQAGKAIDLLNSPEFRQQMADAQRQTTDVRDLLNNQYFKQEIEDAQRQAAKARDLLNSPEFKQQMADAQRQASDARDLLNNQDFKRQMEDAQKQAGKARDLLNSPEFKQQMEDAQRKAGKAVDDLLKSPEFRQGMKDQRNGVIP